MALVLVFLIPVVLVAGGFLFSLINPEIAAGHANYVVNYHILNTVKIGSLFATFGVAGILWLVACFLMVRSKGRSLGWVLLAGLGPWGFAILARLADRASGETELYERFVGRMNWFVRAGYEVCSFFLIWLLAYEAMVLKRNLMILYESATTGVSTAQIIATQNASSGMWAFGEGLEVMYLVVLLYLLWPIVFNVVGRMAAMVVSPKAR